MPDEERIQWELKMGEGYVGEAMKRHAVLLELYIRSYAVICMEE